MSNVYVPPSMRNQRPMRQPLQRSTEYKPHDTQRSQNRFSHGPSETGLPTKSYSVGPDNDIPSKQAIIFDNAPVGKKQENVINLYPTRISESNFNELKKHVGSFKSFSQMINETVESLDTLKAKKGQFQTSITQLEKTLGKALIGDIYDVNNYISDNKQKKELLSLVIQIKEYRNEIESLNFTKVTNENVYNKLKSSKWILLMYTGLYHTLFPNELVANGSCHSWNIWGEISTFRIWFGNDSIEIYSQKKFEMASQKLTSLSGIIDTFNDETIFTKKMDFILKIGNIIDANALSDSQTNQSVTYKNYDNGSDEENYVDEYDDDYYIRKIK